MRKYRKVYIASFIVGLSSLLYIDFYISNFKFSFAGVMFPLLLYIYDDSNPIAFGFGSGISLLFFRWLFYGLLQGVLGQQLYYTMPEAVFYIAYGVMFYAIKKSITSITYSKIFIISIILDIISNILETYLRLGEDLFPMDYKIIKTLLLVGVIRASLVCLMVIGYKYYRLFLVKEEHEKRYRNLLQITSQLKTETYWMEKNMDYIENVMSKAYQLFLNINEDKNRDDWAKEALEIAKDIHEIKKEYKLVVVGIEDIMANRLDNTGMYFDELAAILQESLEREAKSQNKDIIIKFNIGKNFHTKNHYYLMSIFRNVIMNAIDSIDEKGNITISHSIENDNHQFIIEDDGSGIKKKDLPHIFTPGYSTKIDYSTGEINRGLGLALVDSIVQVHLKGSIYAKPTFGNGCTFVILIPVKELEGTNI